MYRVYVDLPEHYIGALCKGTNVFGLITSVVETETLPTIDSFVQFKPEGSTETLERRIAAFEYPMEILKDVISQVDSTNACCKCALPAPDPKWEKLLEKAKPAPIIRCDKESQRVIAKIKSAFYTYEDNRA